LNFTPGEERPSELSSVHFFDPDKPYVFKNDFEDVVFEMHPAIADIKKDMLDGGAVFASLTGSGASVYGLFTTGHLAPLKGDKNNFLIENFSDKGYFTYLSELKNRQLHFQKEQ